MNLEPLFSSTSDDWGTPQATFNELDAEFNFDLDAAADANNHKCLLWLGPQSPFELEDALTCDWSQFGKTIYLNPPYSMCAEFTAKAAEQAKKGLTIVMLIPSRTDTDYFQRHILPYSGIKSNNHLMSWAAGLTDGEGCIFIRKNKPDSESNVKTFGYDMGFSLSMTSEATIRKFHKIFPEGYVHFTDKSHTSNARDVWNYTVRSNKASNVLEAIYPYMVTKREEAFQAIQYQQLGKKLKGRNVDPQLQIIREGYYEKLKYLKTVGERVDENYTTELRFIRGRLKFTMPDGTIGKNSAPFPSMIVVYNKYKNKGLY